MTDTETQELTREVDQLLEQMIADNKSIVANWIVNAIVGGWERPGGRDWAKWETCGYANIRNIVRKAVQKYKPHPDDLGSQLEFPYPGYKKLHRAYLIKRNGNQTIVPTEQLSIGEAKAVLAELMRNYRGLEVHIDEMQRFIDEILIPRSGHVA